MIAGLLALASTSVGRWSVATLVDATLMGLMALSLLVLPISGRRQQWWRVGLFALLIVCGSLTRQSWPTWIAVAVAPGVGYANVHRSSGIRAAWGQQNPWAPLAAVGTVTAVVSWRAIDATLGGQSAAFAIGRIQSSTADPGVWWVIERSLSALVTEIGQLVVLDKALLIAIGLAFFGVWKHRSWPASYAFLGVLFVVMSLSALNTTPEINFRFALAAVPWIVLLGGSWSQPSSEAETKEPEPQVPSGRRGYPR